MRKDYIRLTACMLTGAVMLPSAMTVEAAPSAGVTGYISNIVTTSTLPTAGVSQTLSESIFTADDSEAEAEKATVEDNETPTVEAEYADLAIAQVNDYVNVRKKASEDSEVVGKLYADSAATVIKEKDGWYKITSGSVEGYVKKEFVVVGDEKLAESVGQKVATVSTETLKVRKKASTKAEVLTLVPEGDDYEVIKESKDGWVKISTDEGKGYVSSDYVTISTEFTYAESKEEEEARLAAEEEARIAAEQAAQAELEAQQQQNNATSNAGTSNSNAGTSTSNAGASTSNAGASTSNAGASTSNTGSSNAQSSSASVPSSSSTSTSGTGQAVVNYASQFVGNPYKWGGESLTNGADCSGFVKAVYAHFGKSLPHSSAALRGVGSAVSLSNIQPGDIVCYDGHVAIYAGNNTIVHASNKKDGIKYSSPVNYRKIMAIRRIF